MLKPLFYICLIILCNGCDPAVSQRYQPPLGVSWQWQLQGQLNSAYSVEIYDIDLFDTSGSQIQALQSRGHKVICYFSAGSFENWRDDKAEFPSQTIGSPLDDWQGESWLDIRDKAVWRIMQNRLKLAANKGCDGVEPDNVDGYSNNSGFELTREDQLNYNRFLAQSAHILGLSIGLKNSLDLIDELVDNFDFAVNEQCFEYDECSRLAPFVRQQKPVLNVEYNDRWALDQSERQQLCMEAKQQQFSTLILPLALDDSFRYSCD